MTNYDQSGSNQPADTPAGGNNIQNDAEAFCRIMERLNSVSIQQMEGLFKIAVNAAKDLHGLNSGDSSIDDANIAEFINRMKESAASISEKTQAELEKVKAADGGSFNQAFEHAIANAIQNSVACQQQLNVVGTAILSQAAELLLQNGRSE